VATGAYFNGPSSKRLQENGPLVKFFSGFSLQEWATNPDLKSSLQTSAKNSELDQLKYDYFLINKSPW
jgi:hypothetical protein